MTTTRYILVVCTVTPMILSVGEMLRVIGRLLFGLVDVDVDHRPVVGRPLAFSDALRLWVPRPPTNSLEDVFIYNTVCWNYLGSCWMN